MSDFLDFAVVTGAVIAGLGLAMSLEWLALNGLLRLMPSRHERINLNSAPSHPARTKALVSTLYLFPR
jgi:hypothetical protein